MFTICCQIFFTDISAFYWRFFFISSAVPKLSILFLLSLKCMTIFFFFQSNLYWPIEIGRLIYILSFFNEYLYELYFRFIHLLPAVHTNTHTQTPYSQANRTVNLNYFSLKFTCTLQCFYILYIVIIVNEANRYFLIWLTLFGE